MLWLENLWYVEKNTKNFYSKIEEKVSDARLRGETEKITPPFLFLNISGKIKRSKHPLIITWLPVIAVAIPTKMIKKNGEVIRNKLDWVRTRKVYYYTFLTVFQLDHRCSSNDIIPQAIGCSQKSIFLLLLLRKTRGEIISKYFLFKKKKKWKEKNTWNILTRKPGRVPHYREKKEIIFFPCTKVSIVIELETSNPPQKKKRKERRASVRHHPTEFYHFNPWVFKSGKIK